LEAFLKLRLRILQATGVRQVLESVGEKPRNTRIGRLETTIEQNSADDSLYSVRQCRIAVRTARAMLPWTQDNLWR
jgi:hypothetical protein